MKTKRNCQIRRSFQSNRKGSGNISGVARLAFFWAASVLATGGAWAQPANISPIAFSQIAALHAEKATRSPAQQKVDSQLLFGVKQRRGLPIAAGVPLLRADVKLQPDGRVLVDIDAKVTAALAGLIEAVGGEIINSFPQFNAVRALVPLEQVEVLASLAEVKSIRRADEGEGQIGSVTSEADVTHRANTARSAFGVSGIGVKIGVLSDSLDYMTNSQTLGDLGTVTVLPGQAGTGAGEGTAMLELIHDLAPGAQLYFATAGSSVAGFAQNILSLRAAGCDIIVDDWLYSLESPFQDDIIARAVNTVTADGALYFASAGNAGNKNDGTSSTWEGDFADGGAAGAPVNGKGGRIHDFGGGTNYNVIAANSSRRRVDLHWADPLGASTNDYDVYLLDSIGSNVLYSSTTTQNGTQNPYEVISTNNAGWRVVVVKASGEGRFLHVDTGRSRLTISTSGNSYGHNSATNAFGVAAINVATVYPYPFAGGPANPVETFSSDGPRRFFYQADGTPITPGNFSSTGGHVRQKPDITAADGTKTTLPSTSGFNPFFGTSAAAPHAAAIAALLKSHNKSLTAQQIRTVLTSTALDTEAAGVDRDSGAGIVMAYEALQSVQAAPNLIVSATAVSGGNGNSTIESNECNLLDVVLLNGGGLSHSNVTVTLTTTTPGVTILQPSSAYPDLPPGAAGTNISPFVVSSAVECGTPISFSLVLNFVGGSDTNIFALPTCQCPPLVITSNLPALGPQQTGRINRDGISTGCGYAKAFPGTFTTTGSRSYNAHSLTNFNSAPACVNVKITTPCNNNLFVVAYLGNYNPANLAQNYLSDIGLSPPFSTEFVFTAPPNTNFTVVVHTMNTNTFCSTYTLTVNGLTCPADGLGVCAPQLAVSPANRDFGLVAVGASASQTFTVTNAGFAALTGTASADPPFAVADGSPFSVPPGQTKSVIVSFAPANSGASSGGVVFLSDGGNMTNLVSGLAAVAPAADFTASPTEGLKPLFVSFAEASSGEISNRLWDFGDGHTSTEKDPNHSYSDAGVFTVTLTAFGPLGTNSMTKPGLIVVTNLPAPVVDFVGVPTSGFVPLTVNFTNLTTDAANYDWTFGDGNSSGDKDPVHTYISAGSYTIALTATGAGGTNSFSRTNYIVVHPLPEILSPTANGDEFTFSFNTVTGVSYKVEFNDSLDAPVWQTLQIIPGDGTLKTINDPLSASQRFYRLSLF